jgi:hypothetical protein
MGKTGIQTTPNPAPNRPDSDAVGMAPLERITKKPGWLKKCILALASLRLTVALFVLAIFLIFFGTLAQIDADIWTVVNKYFRAWTFVWIPLQIFFPRDWHVGGKFPFPGGWLLGSVLMINLLAAHAVRFRYNFIGANVPQTLVKFLKRSGIIMIHSGLLVMMLGEFLTGQFAVEAFMSIPTGKSANYLEDQRSTELSVVQVTDADDEEVVVVPASLLRKHQSVTHADLPFTIDVKKYLVNSKLLNELPAGMSNLANAGTGLEVFAVEKKATSGVDTEQKMEMASAYLEFKDPNGNSLGKYLVSQGLFPERVRVGDKTYEVALRNKRIYKPYTVHLKEFHHGVYPGTDIPNDFSSLVLLDDPSRGQQRDVRIYMNHPLRYEGDTFYQADILFGPGGVEKGTVLQVVRNPGFEMPYLSCFLVAVGMLVHFSIHLFGFLVRGAY